MQVISGQVVGGLYRIEGLLGCGGMAAVYRAHRVDDGQLCAVKMVHASLARRSDLVDLFLEESRIGRALGEHPNIVAVLDAGVDSDASRPFLVMELLQGETLEARLLRGPLATADVVRLLEELGSALTHAHAEGVIHRDLKPSNVFLESRGYQPRLKLMDFGIAKKLDPNVTRAVTQVGTPGYAAPEQLGGAFQQLALKRGVRIAARISPATDVWGVALLAYEMLTGETGWQYWDVGTARELPMQLLDTMTPASHRAGRRADLLPAGFDAWFAHATRKDAAERFPTVQEAVSKLCEVLTVGRRGGLTSPSAPDARAADDLPPLSERPERVARRIAQTLPMTDEDAAVQHLHDAVSRRPLDPARLNALYDALASDADRRSRVAQVLLLAGAATDEQSKLAEASVAAPHIRPRRTLTQDDLRTHLRHPNEGPITSALLASVSRALLDSLKRIEGAVDDDDERHPLDDETAIAKGFVWAAKILGRRSPRLYASHTLPASWRLTAELPPNLRLSDALLRAPGLEPRQLAFVAGQAIAATAPERRMRWLIGDAGLLKDALAAAIAIIEPRIAQLPATSERVHPLARAIQRHLDARALDALRVAYDRFLDAGGQTHVGMWAQGAEHTAARAGLLLCDDIAIARSWLERQGSPRRHELMADLVAFFTSRAYRQLRTAMGLAPP